jgi:subtilisin family serine protease
MCYVRRGVACALLECDREHAERVGLKTRAHAEPPGGCVDPLALVKLTALMERTTGRAEVKIGVIDGPVLTRHPDLTSDHLHDMSGSQGAACTHVESMACLHGTFVIGILAAKRNSRAPGICPNCTVLIRPVFADSRSGGENMPSTTPHELAAAMRECIDGGARVLNLSLALTEHSTAGNHELEEALDQSVRRGVIVVAAAGNQGTLGSSTITRHPWVIPVVACDLRGQPIRESNLGRSIGRRGLTAPGDGITSLGPDGGSLTLGGTSVAVPFVTGAIALLSSEFPSVSAAEIRLAVTRASVRRASVVPPLLDASAAYHELSTRM